MATKTEMAAELALLTGNDIMGEAELKEIKADDLAALVSEAKEKADISASEAPIDPLKALAAPGGVTRRKINRGSTRRINRALEAFQKSCVDFAEELDRQAYITDDDGKKTGSLDVVKDLRDLPALMSKAVAEITTPAPDLPKVAASE